MMPGARQVFSGGNKESPPIAMQQELRTSELTPQGSLNIAVRIDGQGPLDWQRLKVADRMVEGSLRIAEGWKLWQTA
jgi:hypothetical protein